MKNKKWKTKKLKIKDEKQKMKNKITNKLGWKCHTRDLRRAWQQISMVGDRLTQSNRWGQT